MTLQFGGAFDLLSLTRSSGGMRTNRNALLEWLGNNEPRIDCDPVTLASRGLLLEGGRTNLALRSQEFDNAAWTKLNASVAADATAAPDGTTTADKIVADSSTGVHRINRTATLVAGTDYIASVYFKAGEYGFGRIEFYHGTAAIAVHVDLSDGTISYASSGTAGVTYGVTQHRNGWWRFWAKVTATGAGAGVLYLSGLPTGDGAGATFTGDGTSGVFIWGAQLEAGAFPSSYIPTTSAAVARAADVCSIPVTDFPWNPAEGTLFLEFNLPAFDAAFPHLAAFSDGTSNNLVLLLYFNGPSSPSMYASLRSGGVTGAAVGYSSLIGAAGITQKVAFAWKSGAQTLVRNGLVVDTDTQAAIPAGITKLNLGSAWNGANANGLYRKALYLPRFASTAELQALTA